MRHEPVGSGDPVTVCHDGLAHSSETPPPPAPVPSFQTSSTGGDVEPLPGVVMSVPPTPVTYGWLAGSRTARAVEVSDP
jgi:hypothetical protein